MLATATSDCPTPTVSIRMTSNPAASNKTTGLPGGLCYAAQSSRRRRRPDVGVRVHRQPRHPGLVAEDGPAGPGRRRVDRQHRHAVAAARSAACRAPRWWWTCRPPGTPVMPTRWALPGLGQQLQQQLLRLFAMVGPGGLQQRDGPRQRGTVAAADGVGQAIGRRCRPLSCHQVQVCNPAARRACSASRSRRRRSPSRAGRWRRPRPRRARRNHRAG